MTINGATLQMEINTGSAVTLSVRPFSPNCELSLPGEYTAMHRKTYIGQKLKTRGGGEGSGKGKV